MEETSTYQLLTAAQKRFVTESGASFDARGWATDYEDNLFTQLHPDTVADLTAAKELTADGAGQRICAPHSSTALAVNTFDWWRDRDLEPLSAAFAVEMDRCVGFEQRHGFGLDRAAHLDVEFAGPADTAVGVEVKLREPYGTVHNDFAAKYFEYPGLWDRLPTLGQHARAIGERTARYETLHAAQLIKHALGLSHSYGDRFTLVYYWHRMPGPIGDQHQREVDRFAQIAESDIRFVAVTVEGLLQRIEPDGAVAPWWDYMTRRYLS